MEEKEGGKSDGKEGKKGEKIRRMKRREGGRKQEKMRNRL